MPETYTPKDLYDLTNPILPLDDGRDTISHQTLVEGLLKPIFDKLLYLKNHVTGYNVEASAAQFGCKFDDSTDDFANLQNAISTVGAAGGGIIRCPSGFAKLSAPLVFDKHFVKLVGVGRDATILKPTGNFDALTFTSIPHPVFCCGAENLSIQFANVSGNGVSLGNSSSGRFKNVLVKATGSGLCTGFLLTEDAEGSSPYYNEFEGCDVSGNGAGGVGYKFASSGSGEGANGNRIVGGHVTNCGHAVWIESGTMNTVTDLVTESISVHHYRFDAHAQQNRVRTGYYEGTAASYLCLFNSGEAGNNVEGPDNGSSLHAGGPTIDGIIDPASVLGLGSGTRINGTIYGKTISIGGVGSVNIGSSTGVTLSTTNYNAQLVDALAAFVVNAGLKVVLSGEKLHVDGTGIGAFGAPTAARQTVTGSRGGNAALASLLTAFATFGWIIDSST